MTLNEFLVDCSSRSIEIYLDGDKLKVRFAGQGVDNEEKEYLKNNRQKIIDLYTRYSIASNFNMAYMSAQQRRLWTIDQIEPGNVQYNLATAVHFQGELDIDALQKTLEAIVDRHHVLRTVYVFDDSGEGLQITQDSPEITMDTEGLSCLDNVEQKKELDRLIRHHSSEPFDLASDLMVRWLLVRLSSVSHVLNITMHHIAADGWSGRILARELGELYGLFRLGRPHQLEALEIQYADYAHWQRDWLRSDDMKRQLNYWKDQLSGMPTLHSFPLDYDRPHKATYSGNRVRAILNTDISQRLKLLAESQRASLFMVMHAALSVLLSRYSGETDIVVGCPAANRDRQELSPLVGFFVNTLVLRLNVEGDMSFLELLERSKDRMLGAYEHQQVPFERLVNEIQPERNMSYNPLVQILLTERHEDVEDLDLHGLKLTKLDQPMVVVQVDLQLVIVELNDNSIRLEWEYATDLFSADTIKRLSRHYECLLEGIVSLPEARLHSLPMLSESERAHQLYRLNASERAWTPGTIHALYEQQVERSPDATAVECGPESLSYRELNTHANQLAHYLIDQGVRPDTLVGLCVERSVDMVIGLLSILKAGGAYVPLDPTYPQQRLDTIINDSSLHLLVTQQNQAGRFGGVTCIQLDAASDQAAFKQCPISNPMISDLHPNHLAYVIYTSGSTGQPKGVMIEHRAAHNFLTGCMPILGLPPGHRWLAVTTITFDIALLEWAGCLAYGGCCVIADDAILRDIPGLTALIGQARIDILQSTPSRWEQLFNSGWAGKAKLTALTGGEALNGALQERLVNRCGTVWNCYGPTEATVWSRLNRIDPQANRRERLSLGGNLPNYTHYVLDAYGQLVPQGVAGELYIGGQSLARGYLNREALTAERFIAHPHRPEERIYKTGDWVRYLPGGALEYLGRLDDQVKVRGYRIELGEIEACLAATPEVERAVVVAREDRPGEKQLVAYVTAASGVEADPEWVGRLRAGLQSQLPAYMVPALYVPMDALPLTPNGKVDKRALPPPAEQALQGKYVAPSSATEKQLAAIWADLLNLDAGTLSATVNFFEIGGHSILAIQAIVATNQAFGTECPLFQLFENSVLSDFAAVVDEALSEVRGVRHGIVGEIA